MLCLRRPSASALSSSDGPQPQPCPPQTALLHPAASTASPSAAAHQPRPPLFPPLVLCPSAALLAVWPTLQRHFNNPLTQTPKPKTQTPKPQRSSARTTSRRTTAAGRPSSSPSTRPTKSRCTAPRSTSCTPRLRCAGLPPPSAIVPSAALPPHSRSARQILPHIKTHKIVVDKLKKGANLFLPGAAGDEACRLCASVTEAPCSCTSPLSPHTQAWWSTLKTWAGTGSSATLGASRRCVEAGSGAVLRSWLTATDPTRLTCSLSPLSQGRPVRACQRRGVDACCAAALAHQLR